MTGAITPARLAICMQFAMNITHIVHTVWPRYANVGSPTFTVDVAPDARSVAVTVQCPSARKAEYITNRLRARVGKSTTVAHDRIYDTVTASMLLEAR